MKEKEQTAVLPKVALDPELPNREVFLRHLAEADYFVSGTHVFCWLCQGDPVRTRTDLAALPPLVCIYSSPCGIIRLQFQDDDTAAEVFSLITRYEVSPYHVEDILEDRDLNFTLQYL